ncbi:hypothetical protein X777_16398 [Ooceraea biroi]|uniref:DUF8207 domain-containing protein n=1 Tax=Ooceraea biroi TaxID=2015173 RepID=A0A026WX38_OOCBI|nr:hypothetical protein X777_16398 [Ooceraea biroi]
MRFREKIARAIEKTSESIRKKHRALKTGMIDDDIAVRTHLGPIIEPLQKIVDNSSIRAVKDEPDVAVEVPYTPKREPDVGLEILRAPKREKKIVIRSGIKRKLPRTESSDTADASTITSTPLTTIGTIQSPMNLLTDDESIFETTNESFATSVQREVQTPEGQEVLRTHLGSLSQKYVEAVIRSDKDIDTVYGVYLSNGGMKFGCKPFDVDHEDHIILDNVRYKGTPGLYELIFKRMPDDIVYSDDDLEKYRSMLLVTNAYRRDHSARGQTSDNIATKSNMEKSIDTLRVKHEELEKKIIDMQKKIAMLDFYRDNADRKIDRRVAELNEKIDMMDKRFPTVYSTLRNHVTNINHETRVGFIADLQNVNARLDSYQKESNDRTREQEKINAAQKEFNNMVHEQRKVNVGNLTAMEKNVYSVWDAIMELRSKHPKN